VHAAPTPPATRRSSATGDVGDALASLEVGSGIVCRPRWPVGERIDVNLSTSERVRLSELPSRKRWVAAVAAKAAEAAAADASSAV
jgi:hypothetical protein